MNYALKSFFEENDDEYAELNEIYTPRIELVWLERELEELKIKQGDVLMDIKPWKYFWDIDMNLESNYFRVLADMEKSVASFFNFEQIQKLKEVNWKIYWLTKKIEIIKDNLPSLDWEDIISEVVGKTDTLLIIWKMMEWVVNEPFPDAKLRTVELWKTKIGFINPNNESNAIPGDSKWIYEWKL